jgi:hypothetical protein
MSALVTAFQSLIPSRFVLSRNGSYWVVEEPGAGNSRFEIACGVSQAFTLDQDGLKVFPFFSDALRGLHAVNDAIVVAVVAGETYVVAVEMKTSPGKTADALKQIESGRLFAAWARELLSFHGHWKGGACKFFGVVSLKPRNQVRKGSTSRSAELPIPTMSPHGGRYPCFVLENHPRVSVADLVKKILAVHGQCRAAA